MARGGRLSVPRQVYFFLWTLMLPPPPTSLSAGAFPQAASDTKPGKICGYSTVIDRIVG